MSLYSELMQKPFTGLTNTPNNTVLAFTASNAELRVISTNADLATGSKHAQLRLRNAVQAVGVGPTIYFEGINLSYAVSALAQIQARFDTTASGGGWDSRLDFTISDLFSGKTVSFTGGAVGVFAPISAASVALGSSTKPWAEVWIGDTALSHFIRITPTGITSSNPDFVVGGGGGGSITTGTATVSIGTPVDPLASFSVGSLNPSTTLAAISILPDLTGKSIFAGFASRFTVGATGVRTAVADFQGASTSAGATAGSHYVFDTGAPSWAATLRAGFYGQVVAGTGQWNLYMQSAANNYIGGKVFVGQSPTVPTALLDVLAGNNTTAVASFRIAHGTPVFDVVSIRGASSAAYYLLRVQDYAGVTEKFGVRGDGVVFIGNITTNFDNATLQITGRTSYVSNQTHDLGAGGNTLASTIYCSTPISVADTKQNDILRITPTDTTLSGTAIANAGTFFLVVSSASAASFARGVNGVVTSAGAGTAVGGFFRAQGGAGHSGTLYAAAVATVQGSATAMAVGLQVAHTGLMNYGVLISSTLPGDQLGTGVFVDSSSMLVTSAFSYQQRSGSTADFLTYIDASGVARFRVDTLGNFLFGGVARRISGDMDGAVHANRLLFVTSGVNQASALGVIPNGTATISVFRVYNSSNPDAASWVSLGAGPTQCIVNSANFGTVGTKPLSLQIDGIDALTIQINRDVCLGPANALTTMTAGHVYIPAVAGVPTGTPTARAGYVPMIYNTTSNLFYFYTTGSWKKSSAYS